MLPDDRKLEFILYQLADREESEEFVGLSSWRVLTTAQPVQTTAWANFKFFFWSAFAWPFPHFLLGLFGWLLVFLPGE